MAAGSLQFLKAAQLASARPGTPVALAEGDWPGVAREPAVTRRGDETASASREPWIELNGYWAAWLRTLFPGRPALLGYTPELGDRLAPFDSLELALIEARVFGGNYLLSMEPRYREALLQGDEKALAAWRQLGRTARWLAEHRSLLGLPAFPQVTQLVELDEETPEIAKLLYRRNASPALARAAEPPPPDPARRPALVAVELEPPAERVRNTILAHAEAGATVVVNGSWWRTSRLQPLRKQEDRDFFTLGKGQVVAYHEAISDPSEFALDVIDLVTHPRRAVRLWNAPGAVALATGPGVMACINYGSPITFPVQARIQGNYRKAEMLRPDGSSIALKTAPRGTTTEVFLPELRRLALVRFE